VEILLRSEEETEAFARKLGSLLQPGMVLGMTGTLGAGKTTFVRGLARGVEVLSHVTVNSPTFNIVNIYPGRETLAHIDLYRVESFEELEGFGFEEYLEPPYIAAIEWFDKQEQLEFDDPRHLLRMTFELLPDEHRLLRLESDDPGIRSMLDELEA